jgi:hypothetical protein
MTNSECRWGDRPAKRTGTAGSTGFCYSPLAIRYSLFVIARLAARFRWQFTILNFVRFKS